MHKVLIHHILGPAGEQRDGDLKRQQCVLYIRMWNFYLKDEMNHKVVSIYHVFVKPRNIDNKDF